MKKILVSLVTAMVIVLIIELLASILIMSNILPIEIIKGNHILDAVFIIKDTSLAKSLSFNPFIEGVIIIAITIIANRRRFTNSHHIDSIHR